MWRAAVVVIPISTQHYMMLKRNLIYTGITRGKRLVVLVGQKKALAMAVKGKQVERRWSKLKERISVCAGLIRPKADPAKTER
jgi:exodeoxyribonuclease V alpha subunit